MEIQQTYANLPEPIIVGSLSRERRIGALEHLERLLVRFSPAERLLLYICTILLGISSFGLLAALNTGISTEVPAIGGSFVEGETGPVRFVNPILAISQADQDVAQVVYSGLMRVLPDGSYTPDLAEKYDISSDGTVYTFTIKKSARFHDGTPLTASDVVFTIDMAQNPDIRSPHRADWDGVTVTTPDPYTVVFTLPHAYAPFIENATLGILPQHLWEKVSTQEFPFSLLNTHPIGSGPYKMTNVSTDISGTVTRYDLAPFKDFTLDGPYLQYLSFAFFSNEDALIKAFNAHQVDAISGISPAKLSTLTRTDVAAVLTPLPRVFGVFFNENHNTALADLGVRQALQSSIDKQKIIATSLQGLGAVLDGPIPSHVFDVQSTAQPVSIDSLRAPIDSATTTVDISGTLKKAGWSFSSSTQTWTKKNQTLSLKLATADEPELVATANTIAQQWRAAGIQVSVQIYPLSDFNNTVLRPRDYDAIVFGEVVGRTPDLFAFWHSSQRNDPGLNLAMYANAKADTLLSKARAATSITERDDLYRQFAAIVQQDIPAIFLYSPDFVYIVPKDVHNIQLGALTIPAERFLNINQWYTDTERVWNFFLPHSN